MLCTKRGERRGGGSLAAQPDAAGLEEGAAAEHEQKNKRGGSDEWSCGVRPPDIKNERSAGEGMRVRAEHNSNQK